jgi:phage-related protein
MDTFTLPLKFDSPRQDTQYQKTAKLGDGYNQNTITWNSDRALWQGTAILTGPAAITAKNLLESYGGTPFLWQFSPEDPLTPFTCRSFSITYLAPQTYQFSVKFEEYRNS